MHHGANKTSNIRWRWRQPNSAERTEKKGGILDVKSGARPAGDGRTAMRVADAFHRHDQGAWLSEWETPWCPRCRSKLSEVWAIGNPLVMSWSSTSTKL